MVSLRDAFHGDHGRLSGGSSGVFKLAQGRGAVDRDTLCWRGAAARAQALPARITVAEAFERFAGADVLSERRNAFGKAVAKGKDDTWSDLFSRALTGTVEPNLDRNALTILYEYPIAEAALAQPCPHDRRVAERFELYACGVELANGYGELNDPDEQRRRFDVDGEIVDLGEDAVGLLGRGGEHDAGRAEAQDCRK